MRWTKMRRTLKGHLQKCAHLLQEFFAKRFSFGHVLDSPLPLPQNTHTHSFSLQCQGDQNDMKIITYANIIKRKETANKN